MSNSLSESGDFPGGLDQIETDWSMVHEPAHVVLRYSSAIQSYLRAIIKNRHDAEEVAQDFFLWVSQDGLPRTRKDRGRFRDYLKKVIRNAGMNFLRRNPAPAPAEYDVAMLEARDEGAPELDRKWLGEWRRCILQRVWRRLREHQKKSRSNLAYTVLRLCATNPDANSELLAQKASQLVDRPLTSVTFRKQLSRGRHKFAHYLVDEVAQTLDDPEPSDVEEELAHLGLIQYVRDFLPLRRRIAPS